MPSWLIPLGSFVLGVGAIAVLVADAIDTFWALDGGTSAILGGLAAGLGAWQLTPPGRKKVGTP